MQVKFQFCFDGDNNYYRNVCVNLCVFCTHRGKMEVKIHQMWITLDTNWFRNREMVQALKNLCLSRAQHQPPRVTCTGPILATIVAHF